MSDTEESQQTKRLFQALVQAEETESRSDIDKALALKHWFEIRGISFDGHDLIQFMLNNLASLDQITPADGTDEQEEPAVTSEDEVESDSKSNLGIVHVFEGGKAHMPACGTGNSLSESDSQDSSDEERLDEVGIAEITRVCLAALKCGLQRHRLAFAAFHLRNRLNDPSTERHAMHMENAINHLVDERDCGDEAGAAHACAWLRILQGQ